MGDGGVVFMPSQHVMERLEISDTSCRGNGVFSLKKKKSIQFSEQVQQKHDKKMDAENEEFGSESVRDGEIENGEIVPEVEEGELRLEKDVNVEVENGEFLPDSTPRREVERWRRGREIEKGEYVQEKRRRGELEKGELNRRGCRGEIEKGEIVQDKWIKQGLEKLDFVHGRGRKGEVENGGYVSSKFKKREIGKEELGKEKGWAYCREGSPPSMRYADEDAFYQKNEFNRNGGNEWRKKSLVWVPPHNKESKTSSRAVEDELGSVKHEHNDGKNYRKESSSNSWLKRPGAESGNISRRYNSDFIDYSSSRSRKVSGDGNHSGFPEKHHSRPSLERSYRNNSSACMPLLNRYNSRHGDPLLPSRRQQDRHACYVESSPHDRARYHDHRDRSPTHFEMSPRHQARHHDYRNRSPVHQRSPQVRGRHYERRDRTPGYSERSSLDREHSPHARSRRRNRRDSTPGYLDRSPHDRDQSPYASSRYHDHRNQIPGHLERSPLDSDQSPRFQARRHDRRDQTPGYLERSPLAGRSHDHGEACRNSEGTETKHTQDGSPVGDSKLGQIGSTGREPCEHSSSKQLNNISNFDKNSGSIESNADAQLKTEEQLMDVTLNSTELPQVIEAPEELLSMEEDMDISDTPPHVSVMADSTSGAWFYLDHFGMEQGPSKLSDLKRLVEEGVLQSDHLIKHSASEWWLTVENAASPSLPANFSSIVSDSVTQLVSPPEAPGNLLSDTGDAGHSTNLPDQERSVALSQLPTQLDDSSIALGDSKDLHIDDRVAALLEGYTVTPGRELAIVGEALHMTFEFKEWEKWINSEGFTRSWPSPDEQRWDRRDEQFSRSFDSMSKEVAETRANAFCYRDFGFSGYTSDWFCGRWSCKGGDWKRNDEAAEDRSFRRKFVLNDGFPLCQMPKSGYEDPRWRRKDELYYPSRVRRLSLPPWAFSVSEERTDCNGTNRSNQIKLPVVPRGVKGTVLPVVRINTCVVSDYIPSVGESRMTVRGYERHSSRSIRPHSSSSDGRITGAEGVSQSERTNEKDLQGLQNCVQQVIIPKNRVCSVDDLQLHLGDWYYVDGAGHEHGPSSFSELQVLVDKGTIQKHTSVFRKLDNIWVPVSYAALGSKAAECSQDKKDSPIVDSSKIPLSQSDLTMHGTPLRSSSFHSLHPQFIGYTRGKLHELVMKSYKSREFAAAINEVLDPWINAKQPKKDLEKHSHDMMQKFRRSEDDYIRSGKRARLLADESEDEYELEVDLLKGQKDGCLFEDLCGDATFRQAENMNTEAEMESWGLLNGNILARIFHFLRTDMRSIAFSAATCKHWNAAVKFYRDISKQVDLSEAGPSCTDSMFRKIMNAYDKMKMTSIILVGCTNISAGTLEEVLFSLPYISSVNIGGCSQFGELSQKLPNIKWIKYRSLSETRTLEESSSKIKSLKQIADRSLPFSKAFKGSNSHSRGYSDSGDAHSHDSALNCRDSEIRSFRQGFYKRKKLLDARRSSSLLSHEARMRRWLYRKPENGYKRLEEFITLSLKYIMKENTYDFFIPKVTEIEEKMKNGYYMDNGLGSIKEDIKRMCRDAIKAKSRAGARDMNHVIMLFIQLVKKLEENSKSSLEREEMMKMLKDNPSTGFYSAASRIKKKHIKSTNERKSMNRGNGSIYGNGTSSYGDYATDREIKRRLSKLNKRTLDSESETSDDPERSSEDACRDGDSTASDTESDPELYSEVGMRNHRNDSLLDDHSLDSISEDREWGARMTKASLVPPVTRKYEVIDQYVIIADEEEVQRKMLVTLPEDYAEKINAQKSGVEESDLELPEVKDYKPRKQLGEEVLEQEVYGIDPYTHNLLLDSMPDELDWPLLEKHLFIEDTLLRTLNTQVRHFTGTGNAPMKYPLQPVVEEIQRNAEENGHRRIIKMCQGILKAIQSRPEDNYVSYRKGLGVVCNREEGFEHEDFVVEFLGEVYPVWKWFEKQDGIRSLQKNSKDPAPEFYNIYLERPKGDQDGYDLVVVDAMHKANYASRICHSCRPNCEAKVTAVDGQYQIGVYSVRPIGYGEEITFDYNSVTESKEEYEASVCLCGSQICRGSYLNLTGEGAYQKVISECHGILDRHRLMLEACQLNFVSEEDYIDLGKAGLGTCLLAGLPDWLIAYTAHLVRFINFERTKLPEEILRHNVEEKKKFFLDICHDVERSEAEVQAEGVYNQRLQNLALTLDKVRYVMRCVYTDVKKAAPPLQKLSPAEVVSFLWKGEGSLVEELLKCMALHMEDHMLRELKSKIRDHDPSGSDDLMGELRKSLIWLRDEVRDLPCTYKCRHDAAADLIHIYAYTKCFFRVQPYKTVTSPPVYISPLDLGPKYLDKLGSGFKEYCKTYAENYCLGQLIYWHSQNNADPDRVLIRARRGCLLLPDIASFYAKANMSSKQRVYGPRTLRFMLSRMEKQPQRPWPKERIWSFKSTAEIFGSPMLDALLNKTALDRDMMHWLKNRPSIFYATGDR